MKSPTPTIFTTVLLIGASAGTNAWSCGPSSYSGVIRSRYGVCVPPSSQDLFTPVFPEIMIQRAKQRYYRNPWIEEYRNRSSNRNKETAESPRRSPWTRRSSPPYDITETDTAIQVAMDVPGIDMSNLSITLDETDQKLTVTGRREQASRSNSDAAFTEWTQTFVLKNPLIQAKGIAAQLLNGVLTITLPKEAVPPKNVRTIPIVETTEGADVTISNTDANLVGSTDSEVTESVDSIVTDEDINTSSDETDPTNNTEDEGSE